MLRTMAAKHTGGRAAKKGATLAEIGKRAAERAQHDALAAALARHAWNLSAVAVELGLSNASNVIRAIRRLGLSDAYERQQLRPGPKN